MSIVLIVIYCLIAAVVIFGLTFSQELREEKQRKPKRPAPVISIETGKHRPSKLHRRA
jgi:hypothetical protein